MKKIILACFFITYSATIAQNIDSLFNEFVSLKKISHSKERFASPASAGEHGHKCGLPLLSAVRNNIEKFTPEQQAVIAELQSRPENETSFVTPSGYFRVHYDTSASSINAPGYDLDELAEALDYSYDFEVNVLGYPAPPPDNGKGGDNKYDVYITNLPVGYYGYTEADEDLGGDRHTAFTVIDNDFYGRYTQGIEGAKVTVAHEFHHAIQMGNYIFRYEEDGFYYEITSTAMEEFVYDDINDYYAYMPTYFRNPEIPFARNSGYDLAIWNIFLKERYGYDILKRIWELMPEDRAIAAIEAALSEEGTTFRAELNEFGKWVYFTGYRNIEGEYFEEGNHYPLIDIMETVNFTPPQKKFILQTRPVSNIYYRYLMPNTIKPDTLISIITNGDLKSGMDDYGIYTQVEYSILDYDPGGGNYIEEGYYSLLKSEKRHLIAEGNIFNTNIINQDSLVNETGFVFPQPFSYRNNVGDIKIPVSVSSEEYAELSIYTPSMNLVYNGEARIVLYKNLEVSDVMVTPVVVWNARGNGNEKLATGVYIYVTKSGDKIKKGKLVIKE